MKDEMKSGYIEDSECYLISNCADVYFDV